MKIADAEVGRAVVYREHPEAFPEQGIITHVGSNYVHVRFNPLAEYGTACRADDLELMCNNMEQL